MHLCVARVVKVPDVRCKEFSQLNTKLKATFLYYKTNCYNLQYSSHKSFRSKMDRNSSVEIF